MYYHVSVLEQTTSHTVLKIGFGVDAQNDVIVPDAVRAIDSLHLTGGPLVKFNGPSSLPVAMALAHKVAHLFGAVAVWDPKLGKYIVAISHRPDLALGARID